MNNAKGWNDLAEMQEDYNNGNNLLLVDGNNLAYRWIQRRNYDDFEDDYIKTVESLSKSYSAGRVIVCFDFGKSYFRSDMSAEYKSTRKKPKEPEEIAKYEAFFSCLNATYENMPFEKMKYRGIEADDLITYFVENCKADHDHTWIVSSDRDLYQLLADNVSIFNMFSRREIDLDYLDETMDISPELYLFSRYIEGDKSDAIFGVEGIGPKRAQALSKEYKTLEALLEALPLKGRSKYIHNLNDSTDLLQKNEQMINLKRYNKDAILAGKDGEEVWKELQNYVNG